MTRVADSSFLIALFDPGDPRRARAIAWAEHPESIQVPQEVLSETLGVLHRRKDYATAEAVWRALVRIPHLELVETTDVERIAEVFVKARGKLSWVDAAVVAACRAEGAKPLCFDDDIVRAVGK